MTGRTGRGSAVGRADPGTSNHPITPITTATPAKGAIRRERDHPRAVVVGIGSGEFTAQPPVDHAESSAHLAVLNATEVTVLVVAIG